MENNLCIHRVRRAPRWSRAGCDVSLFKRISLLLQLKLIGLLFGLGGINIKKYSNHVEWFITVVWKPSHYPLFINSKYSAVPL